ncbi:MAG: tetraacyldisaccharide 4'-kinase [Gammaproteobacteria bacterium]|nr:tetraacyldisaccharide 4'-kinase [Gammaproteobacteria bacterium]
MSLVRQWWSGGPLPWLLWPLSLIYRAVVWLRRQAYATGVRKTVWLPVPVVVVGNLTVGGSGKTPLVIHIVQQLASAGWRPGVVLRGYGGGSAHWPLRVQGDTDPALAGDEAVLLAQRSGCPVVASPDRVAAARALLAEADVLVADDGLQHLALGRDLEVVVVDQRGFGNGWLLPAGPLREPASRLEQADLVVSRGHSRPGAYSMALVADRLLPLGGGETLPADHFRGQPVHAVAGIGWPEHFFATLRELGMQPVEHAFPDHHAYSSADLRFAEPWPVIMTEKDAVKCKAFATDHSFALRVRAKLEAEFDADFLQHMNDLRSRKGAGFQTA